MPVLPDKDFIVNSLEHPIEIVFEDEHFVIVFKPAGLMVHRGPKTLASEPILLQVLRDQLDTFLFPVHRLDRPTAGLIAFGKTSEAASRLGPMFSSRLVTKHYQALVRGWIHSPLDVDRPLLNQTDHDRASQNETPANSAKEPIELDSLTRFNPLARFEAPWPSPGFSTSRFTLLEAQPLTGRWHQIRRHLNAIAHPIIGDHRHGDHRWNQLFFASTGIYRMLLTAMRIEFRHPFTDELVSLLVGRGASFDRAIETLAPYRIAEPTAPVC